MSRLLARVWVLAGVVVLTGVVAGHAQDGPVRRRQPELTPFIIIDTDQFDDLNGGSHKALPGGEPGDVDPASLQLRWDALHKRLQAHQALRDYYEKLKKSPELLTKDPRVAQELANLVKTSGIKLRPNDPLLKKLETWLKERPGGLPATQALSPEAQEELKKLLETLKGQNTTNPVPSPNLPPRATEPPPEATIKPPVAAPKPSDPEEEAARLRFARWLAETSERLARSRHGDSDLVRQIRHDLDRYSGRGSAAGLPRWGGDSQIARRLSSLTRDARSTKVWSNLGLTLPNLRLPEQSMPSLPKFGSWGRPPSFGGLPNLGRPSLSTSGPSSDALLWFAAFAITTYAAWRLSRIYRGSPSGRPAPENQPWPVDPESVATSGELIQAFEHLSLLKLGEGARTRNHLEIAVELGGDVPERREAADVLASLYERARYAPDRLLSAEAIGSARRSLALLAGGAA